MSPEVRGTGGPAILARKLTKHYGDGPAVIGQAPPRRALRAGRAGDLDRADGLRGAHQSCVVVLAIAYVLFLRQEVRA